jgi:hypothetical protein
MHAAVVKEKADLEKVECDKAQQFCNLLRKKLAELHINMEESIAVLGGDAWTSPLPMPLSPSCWSGSERRFKHCLRPSLSVRRISLVLHWLVFLGRLRGWNVDIYQRLRN